MAVLVAAAAFLSTLFGGWVAVRISDRRHLILGLSAGVMLGVVLFDVLPEALETGDDLVLGVPTPMLAVAVGFLALHVLERATAVHRGHEDEYGSHAHHSGVGLVAAGGLVVHSALDGFGIGLAFASSTELGATVATAVIAHDFADGFNTYTVTTLYGNSRRRAYALLGLDAVAPVAGAALAMLVSVPESVIGLYLGAFGGFLLYLATGDILPEAHSRHPSHATIACTVAGMVGMWLVVGAVR